MKNCSTGNIMFRTVVFSFLVSVLVFNITDAWAVKKEVTFIVQPILSESKTRQAYTPLVNYLSNETGYRIKLKTLTSFQAYWNAMRNGGEYDLILDAAHFTSYRTRHLGYTVLAKIPDTVSFSLISNINDLILEPDDLIGKTLLTLPPPSLGAVRVDLLFPNPMRLPVIKASGDAIAAIKLVMAGKATSAIVPTPLLNQYPDVNVITTTKPVPHMAFSASPNLNPQITKRIRKALLNANRTDYGREMLKQVNLPKFVAAKNSTYQGYEYLLRKLWGYGKK